MLTENCICDLLEKTKTMSLFELMCVHVHVCSSGYNIFKKQIFSLTNDLLKTWSLHLKKNILYWIIGSSFIKQNCLRGSEKKTINIKRTVQSCLLFVRPANHWANETCVQLGLEKPVCDIKPISLLHDGNMHYCMQGFFLLV